LLAHGVRLCGLLVIVASPALGQSADSAQARSVVAGRVTGADGAPIAGATVGLFGTSDSTTSSDSGRFVLRDVGPRSYVLLVRKVGFQPARRLVTVSRSGTTDVTLSLVPAVHMLSTVVTTSTAPAMYHRVGLDARMRGGIGQFLTYDQIQNRHATLLQLLQTFRGFHLAADAYASPAAQAVTTHRAGECVGFLIDGVRQSAITPREADEVMPIEDIGAIEYYQASEVPAEWADASSPRDSMPQVRQRYGAQSQVVDSTMRPQPSSSSPNCSVALIWTRTRLGLSTVETQTDRSVLLETSRGRFAGSPGAACELGAAADTAAFVIYGVLEGGPASESRFADSALRAIRSSFALPTDVPLPAFGFPFRAMATDTSPPTRPSAPGLRATPLLQVAPAPSGVAVFTLDSLGALSDARIAASSLSGAADTAILAAIQGAGAAHAFPRFVAPKGDPTIRFDLAFSTMLPGADDRSIALGRLETPVWPIVHPVVIDSGSQPSLRPPAGTAAPARDSAAFAFVVDEHGRAVPRTARVFGGPGAGIDPVAYRTFLSRVVRALPQFAFRPAVVGSCPVAQLILQPFGY